MTMSYREPSKEIDSSSSDSDFKNKPLSWPMDLDSNDSMDLDRDELTDIGTEIGEGSILGENPTQEPPPNLSNFRFTLDNPVHGHQRKPSGLEALDNPPLPMGTLNRTTLGMEIEFLLAVTASKGLLADPHPHDLRDLTNILLSVDEEDPKFQLTARNAIIDALTRAGMVAVKSIERDSINFTPDSDFGWGDRLDNKLNDVNGPMLDTWIGNYTWNPYRDDSSNTNLAIQTLLAQFRQFHADNGLALHQTIPANIAAVGKKVKSTFLSGAISKAMRTTVRTVWEWNANQLLVRWKNELEARARTQVDPISVEIPGANPKFRAWRCAMNSEVSADNAFPQHYDMSFYEPPMSSDELPLVPGLYKWFGAVLKTPILDYAHPETAAAISKAVSKPTNSTSPCFPVAL